MGGDSQYSIDQLKLMSSIDDYPEAVRSLICSKGLSLLGAAPLTICRIGGTTAFDGTFLMDV